MSSSTACGSLATPSMAVLTRRITGIVTGSMVSPCAANSSATRAAAALGRQRQQRLARRAHRLAVEMNGKAVFHRRDRDGLVEALRQMRLHLDLGAAHRIRVGKLLSRFEVVEDITHAKALYTGDLLARRPVDDDQTGGDQAKRQENTNGQRLIQEHGAAQHAEHRRQEGEARQARCRIARAAARTTAHR